MRTGASRPPSATPSVRIASKPANMRARTASSVIRARIVNPPTSISALPTPTRPSSTIAATCSGTAPMSASGAPNSAIPIPNQRGEPAAPDQREGEERAEHAARADGRVQDADARVARVEQVDREDDGEHGQAPARERLDDPEPRDQRQRAIARDGREALDDVAAGRSAHGVRPRRRVVGEAHDDQSPQQGRRRARGEGGGRPARGEEHGRGHRTAEGGERVQHAAHRVRARQVLRGLGQGGEQGRMRRPVERHGDRRDDREPVRRGRGAAGRRHGRGTREHRAADHPDARQDPLATNPVGQRREERREERGGRHAGRGDDADRGDAALAVRHDGERDHERALARPHRGERDLRPVERSAGQRAEHPRPEAASRGAAGEHGGDYRRAPRHAITGPVRSLRC